MDSWIGQMFARKWFETGRAMELVLRMAATTGIEDFKKLLTEGGLPELGPGPRAGILPHTKLTAALDPLLTRANIPSVSRDLVRALILLWHDRLDAAHVIAQGIENADGSFVHGIVHRREPDHSNAEYWFRRVHDHPAYPKLAQRVEKILVNSSDASLKEELLPRNEWDPFAFIHECAKAARLSKADSRIDLLRRIQGAETEVLLEYFLAG